MTVVRISTIAARHPLNKVASFVKLHVFVLHWSPGVIRIWRERAGVHVAIAFSRSSGTGDDRKAEGCKVLSAFPQPNPGKAARNADSAAWSSASDHDGSSSALACASMRDAPGDEGGEVGDILVC